MGERKVQAKYYPPDFDPSNLPRIRKKKDVDDAVRFMLPMSVRCETCGEFMGTGLKFNARKSNTGNDYLGIRIWRFSMKCKGCPATFSICTDPENSDYTCETGVRRNYEPWRDAKKQQKEADEERSRQDRDAIQALENKTLDAKEQMDQLDQLDEIKTTNAKRGRVNVDNLLASYQDVALSNGKKNDSHHNDELRVAKPDEGSRLSMAHEAEIERHATIAMQRETQPTNPVGFGTNNSSTAVIGGKRPKDRQRGSSIGTSISKDSFLTGMKMSLKVKKKISKPSSSSTTLDATKHKLTPTTNSLVAYDDSSSDSDDE